MTAATARVYCGCTMYYGYTEGECSWEGDVPISEHPDDREFDHFTCPRCGAEGLAVLDHAA